MLLLFSFGKRWLLFFTSVLLGNNFLILVYFVPLKKKKKKVSLCMSQSWSGQIESKPLLFSPPCDNTVLSWIVMLLMCTA